MSQEDIGLPGMIVLDRMNSRHIPQSGAQMTWLIIVRLKETYLEAHSLFSPLAHDLIPGSRLKATRFASQYSVSRACQKPSE